MKKKTVTQLKKILWKEFSRYIRLRDAIRTTGNTKSALCITCKQLHDIKGMDAGHGITRGESSTLFDERNVHAQCKRCNMRGGEQYLYMIEVDKIYGEGTAEELQRLRHETKKFSRPELIEMIEDYKQRIKEIDDEYGSPFN
jgi:hypothetical protein